MQLIVPVLGSFIGGGAAGSAVAAAGAASTLGTISTVLGVGSGLAQLSYQNKVAAQTAVVAEENKNRALQEGQTAQREQDEAAAAQIAEVTAAQAASGFALTSPTYQRVQARNRILARRDAERIRQTATDTAQNFETQRIDAINSKQSLLLPALAGVVDIKKSLISGADLVSGAKAKRLNNTTRTISTTY